jgi:hypothetical protein
LYLCFFFSHLLEGGDDALFQVLALGVRVAAGDNPARRVAKGQILAPLAEELDDALGRVLAGQVAPGH